MTSLDLTSLKFWESVGLWGFVFVWVGVAGEGVEIFIKLFRAKLYDRKKRIFDVIGAVFWIILVVALATEFLGNMKAMQIADGVNSRLNAEAGQARKDAGEAMKQAGAAIERAAMVESNNAVLSLRIEELHSNNLALEQQMQPRLIESSRATTRLTQFAGTKAVIISATGGDCPSTANQIGGILQAAKWNVEGVRTEKAVPPGVSLGISSSTNGLYSHVWWSEWTSRPEGKSQSHFACAALADELNNGSIAANIDEHMYFNTSLRFDGIVIFVGPRPNQVDEQISRLKNNRRHLEQRLEDVKNSERPLMMSLIQQKPPRETPPELDRLMVLETQLENARIALDKNFWDLWDKQNGKMHSTQTNRGGIFNLGYEQLP
jgi:hypothetical protein